MMQLAHRLLIVHQRRALIRSTNHCYAFQFRQAALTRVLSSRSRPPPLEKPAVLSSKTKSRAQPEENDTTQPKSSQWQRMKGWTRTSYFGMSMYGLVFALPLIICVWHVCPVSIIPVTGPSMTPTINPECTSSRDTDYTKALLLVQTHIDVGSMTSRAMKGEKVTGRFARGDIVIYKTPHKPESLAVKRVVGLPGDVVTPLPGGESEEGVVIPYNHIWVEGDVGDRKQSTDSNSFGPLSQQLVEGRVLSILQRWWNPSSWKSAAKASKTWPAKEQRRIREDAVEEAANDPDHVAKFQEIEGEAGQDVLQMLQTQGEKLRHQFMTNYAYSVEVKKFWTYSKAAARAHHDPASKVQAQEIVDKLEIVFGRDAIRQVSSHWEKGRRSRGSPAQFDIDSILDDTLDRHADGQGSAVTSRS